MPLTGKSCAEASKEVQKEGEVVVQAVAHENGQTTAQDYYCGKKESEVLIVRKLLERDKLAKQKISLDALHCKPKTLLKITKK